jgi:hypothetical protein
MSKRNEQKMRKKNKCSQASWLEKRESFSYTITMKKSFFELCCCSMHNSRGIIGD